MLATTLQLSKATVVTTAPPIVLQYTDLLNRKNLEPIIEQAYGPKGLGILFVEGIPDYSAMRKRTLPLFSKLANLPKDVLKKYERPEIFHSQGWSCGVEQFQGKYDISKGSYYINAARDGPLPITESEAKMYTTDELKMNVSNLWVEELPEIEKNVKELSKRMMEVGALLAYQIDNYTASCVPNYPKGRLERIVTKGRNHVGRMLHYFPFEHKGETDDDWCGWHNDHGSLTALTSALLTDKFGNEASIKVSTGGLHAKNRFAEMARIVIPKDMLAFQLGESTHIHTGGRLEATPHCVIRSEELADTGITRNTYALFMEPEFLEIMDAPLGTTEQEVSGNKAYKIPALSDRWNNGILFKEFHTKTMKYYS